MNERAPNSGARESSGKATMLPKGAWLLTLETAFWIGLAAGAWLLSFEFAGKDMLFRWGAEFWPRLVASLIVILSVLQFVLRYRSLRVSTTASASRPFPAIAHGQAARMAITFLFPLVYAFLMPRMGYYLLTLVFIPVMMLIFGVRRPVHLFGTAAAIYVAFILVFSKFLAVPLPTGYWPGFYELNTSFADIFGL